MSDITEMELDLGQFIVGLFNNPPMPPFSFRLELDAANPAMFNNFMQSLVLHGCEVLFDGKQLHTLSEEQVGKLREYLLSVGYDADYDNVVEEKIVKVYDKSGSPGLKKLSSTRLNVTFKAANPALNNYNSHHMNPFGLL